MRDEGLCCFLIFFCGIYNQNFLLIEMRIEKLDGVLGFFVRREIAWSLELGAGSASH